jgi:hypothetical protein
LRGYIWILKEQARGSKIISYRKVGSSEESEQELASSIKDMEAAKRHFFRTSGNILMSYIDVDELAWQPFDNPGIKLRIESVAILEALEQITGGTNILHDATKVATWIIEEQTRGGTIIAQRIIGGDCPLLNHVKNMEAATAYFFTQESSFLCS